MPQAIIWTNDYTVLQHIFPVLRHHELTASEIILKGINWYLTIIKHNNIQSIYNEIFILNQGPSFWYIYMFMLIKMILGQA